MLMLTPSSQVVKAVMYDSELEELDVYLADGKAYRYTQVPREAAADVVVGTDVGAYYNKFIRAQFACERIYPKEV